MKKQTVMIWVCFSLTLCCTHSLSHTHTHTHTHAYWHIDLSLPHLFVITISVRAALQWHLFSLSSNHSLYLQRLCLRLSAGLLYVMHCMCSLTYHRIKNSYLVLSRLEMLKASGFFSMSCCRLQWVRFHEVSLDWSPLDLFVYKFCFVISQFCVYARQTALFCSFIKDCVD